MKSQKKSQSRLVWPDIVRIVAIYCILQIHTTTNHLSSSTATSVLQTIDSIGVPLFVLVSGFLLLGKDEDYKTFFRKRCFKVLLPWIVWTFLYMLYFYYLHHGLVMSEFFIGNEASSTQWFHFFFSTFMSSLWFLPMIFGIYLMTPFLRIIVKYARLVDIYYLLILWFLFLSVLPYLIVSPLFPTWEPTVIFAPLQFSGYFLLGFFLIKHQQFRKWRLPILFFVSIMPFIVSAIPLHSRYINEFTTGYLSPGTVIASVWFFYFLYAMFTKFDMSSHPHVRKIIVLFSGASFGVYLLNEMFLDYFKNDLLRIFHSEFLITLLTFFVLSLIVILLQRIPLVKYIVPR